MARKINENRKEVVLNRDRFDALVGEYTYKDIWHEMQSVWGMDITYNALGSLIRGKNTWKLTYAWVVSKILGTTIEDLFILVDVDVDEKIEETLKWQEKYQKRA